MRIEAPNVSNVLANLINLKFAVIVIVINVYLCPQ